MHENLRKLELCFLSRPTDPSTDTGYPLDLARSGLNLNACFCFVWVLTLFFPEAKHQAQKLSQYIMNRSHVTYAL